MNQTLERTAVLERKTGRDVNLDMIRGLAALLVVCVHFLLRIDFYYYPMEGPLMLAMTVLRMTFMACVPLFLLLTGYLCCHKEWSGRYYLGLSHVLLTYGIVTVMALVYRWHWKGEEMSLVHGGKLLLDFTGVASSWYIEMYIGLFLLIPFLNLLWEGAGNRRRRGALVITLLGLTTLAALTNFHHQLLPDWWVGIYPLTYYFLGAWFRAYPPKIRWSWGLPAYVGTVLLGGVGVFFLFRGEVFPAVGLTDWYGPTVVVSSCLLFLLLRTIPVDRAFGWVRWLVKKASALSLGIYLASWIFDDALYPVLWERVPDFSRRLPLFFIMVPVVYLGAAALAQVAEWLRLGITRCINRAVPQARLK